MNKQHTVRATGIAWYARQDYPRILEIMEDGEDMPASFYHWDKAAERLKRDEERKGHIVVRAVIDPDEFVEWCTARGLAINAQARMRFANETAARVVNQTH